MKNTQIQKTTPVSQVLTEDNIKAGCSINRSTVRSAAMVGLALSVTVLSSHQGAIAAENNLTNSSSNVSEQNSSESKPVVSFSTVPSESTNAAPKPVLQSERREILENQVTPSTTLRTSLEKLQQTRQNLQDSLKTLKQEESKLKVVLAESNVKVSDATETPAAKNKVAISANSTSVNIPVIPPTEESPTLREDQGSTVKTATVVIPVPLPEEQKTENENQANQVPSIINLEQKQSVKSAEIELNKPEANNSPQIYQIKKGDTLNQLAQRYDVTVSELMKVNRISDPNLVKINQQLLIPTNQKVGYNSTGRPQSTIPVLTSNLPRLFETKKISPNLPTADISKPSIDVKGGNSEGISNSYASKQLQSQVASLEQPSGPISIPVEPPEVEKGSVHGTKKRPPQPSIIGTAPSDPTFSERNLQIPVDEPTKPEWLNTPAIPGGNLPAFTGYIWPTKGVITSGYGRRWGRMHKGIDIGTSTGTPVVAAAPGEVISAGWNSGGYGNLVAIQHADGSVTFYAHNSRVLVHTGQIVQQGEQISAVGSTGHSTGPHLHFEIRPNGRLAANPIAFLPNH